LGKKVSFLKMVPLKICSNLTLGSFFLPIGWNTYLSYLWEENPLIVTSVENQLTNKKT